jgi:hypothetical protein
MSLYFRGPTGSFEQPWVLYALMRDCVQHHLERGAVTRAFRAVHRISRALREGNVVVPARRLNVEARFLRRALRDLPVTDLAISAHTLAAYTPRVRAGLRRRTRVVGRSALSLPLVPERGGSLHDLFGPLLDELVRITAGARVGELVDVHDC